MSDKRIATFWDRVWVNLYGWTWLGSWFGAIWIEEFRWQLFWTGMLMLFMAMSMYNAVDFSRKTNSHPDDADNSI